MWRFRYGSTFNIYNNGRKPFPIFAVVNFIIVLCKYHNYISNFQDISNNFLKNVGGKTLINKQLTRHHIKKKLNNPHQIISYTNFSNMKNIAKRLILKHYT